MNNRLIKKLLAAFCLLSCLMTATPVSAQLGLLPAPRLQAFYNGVFSPGAKANFYIAGTTTRLNTYNNPDGLEIHKNANPVVAGSDGLFGPIYVLARAYKLVLTTSSGATIYTQDNIQGSSSIFGSIYDPRYYGVTCDGTTDDAAAWQAAITAVAVLYVPPCTSVIGTSLDMPSNRTIIGSGQGVTTIKAKANAGLGYIFIVSGSISNVYVSNLTLDGNRANGGMPNSFSAAAYISGSRVTLENLEIKQSQFAGIFMGSNDFAMSKIKVNNCWIHHNGGVTNSSGNGLGIFSTSSFVIEDISITNNIVEYNYNTITKPNDSSGIAIGQFKGGNISWNTFRNNFNVSGGQLGLGDTSATPVGDQVLEVNIEGNKFLMNTAFGTPANMNSGIEIAGSGFTITGNVIDYTGTGASAGAGIYIEGSTGVSDGTISGNTIRGVTQGVALRSGDPHHNISIVGNIIAASVSPGYGIGTEVGQTYINFQGNDFSESILPLAGTFDPTDVIANNLPFSSLANYRTHLSVGAVAAANNLILDRNGNEITGNTQINLISNTGWSNGDIITLTFSGTPTLKHGQTASGAYRPIYLASGMDFTVSAFTSIQFKLIQDIWCEISRTVI